jgi:hypothetical protein|tara:strand:- start:6730 stop:6999 length:270 start_codon:yes stop_codon:yes gene_type:complete
VGIVLENTKCIIWRVQMKKFGNAADKINVILSVFNDDECLKINDIVSRVKDRGYRVKDAHLRMFIYYNMIYKHLKKEEINGTNRYSILT